MFFAVCAFAQIATTTSLVGTITDASGSAIPNVKVTAVETGTSDKYTGLTNSQGYYSLEFVRVGTYSITAEAGGFERVTKTGIPVSINQIVRTDITLTVGSLTQSVSVEATVVAIATDDAAVSEIMSTRAISDLPLNGRDPMQLARMTPGVLTGTKSSATGVPPGEDFNGAGTREIQNSLSLDGISVLNNLITTTPTRPMVEAVQEVEIQTGTYSAQYGSYMGVHVNMISKSGTNALHGALVEFFRNQVLDARNFFTLPTPANPTAAKPPLRQNQFGYELDGPVYIPKIYNGKNKTFFMSSYEGYRLVQQATQLSTLMPAIFFSGNFSSVPTSSITGGAIKDPLNGNTPFPGNVIPSNRISPIVAKLQTYYPATNLPGLASNFSVPVPTTISTNQTVDRVDQNIGDKVRLYVRAHYQSENVFGGNAIPVNASTLPVQTSNYTVGYTHTLTPTLVNDFRVGRNRLDTDNLNYFTVNGQKSAGTDLGITGFTGDTTFNNPGIPEFNVTGFSGLGNSGSDWYQTDSTYQASEQLSWSHGAHNIMGGAEFRRLATAREATNSPRGQFTFNGTLSGYAPADFILGLPQSFSTPGPEVHGHVAEWRDGFFVMDKWQISRKLTLNYGLRYELPTVAYTVNGNATELNASQTAIVGGTKGFHFTNPNHSDWAPRLGFAYRINDKTVFRGGAGIYYNPNQTNSYTFLSNNPPFATILNCTWSVGLTPVSVNSPFSSAGVCPTGPSVGTIITNNWNQPTARMNQWSAGLARQLWSGAGVEAQYLGSHSYHLDRSFYNNTPLLPGPGSVNTRRPNAAFGVIRTIANDEIANYESMGLIFHQRMSHGLQMQASYTWSHTLDVSTDSNGGGAPMNPFNWRSDYGNSNWDIRHRLVASFVYDIPFFATKNPLLNGAFAHWQMNGVITLQTGTPFNVTTGTDTANTASSGTYRPNLVGTATENCGRGHMVGCIDPTAFSISALYPATSVYAYGNLGRNIFHGPGAQTVDWSLAKNFPIKERLKFQFRLETFGLFNHSNFGNPSAGFATSSFGNITSLNTTAPGTRNIQLAGKLQF
jgi:hypothetical protein